MKSDPKHIFDEYIIQGETSRKQRAEHWQIAIGLQGVDKQKSYQMASSGQSADSKCSSCTLGKQRILKYLTENPHATQKKDGRDYRAIRTNVEEHNRGFKKKAFLYINI